MFEPWSTVIQLALESSEVVGLRVAKIASGDAEAHREVHLMVSEKVDAIFEAGARLMSGATATHVIDHFRERVTANARRLSADGRQG
jgi:hypothetical protein